MPKIDQKSWLVCTLSELEDTFLSSVDLDEFHERARNPTGPPLMQRILDSGLVEAAPFPPAVSCPELVLECMNRYDPIERCVRSTDGEVLLRVSQEVVVAIMKRPEKEQYEDWTVCKSKGIFS